MTFDRFMRLVLRLYPRAWRARYDGEVRALVEQQGASWPQMLDLIAGGLRERIRYTLGPDVAGAFLRWPGVMPLTLLVVTFLLSALFSLAGTGLADWLQADRSVWDVVFLVTLPVTGACWWRAATAEPSSRGALTEIATWSLAMLLPIVARQATISAASHIPVELQAWVRLYSIPSLALALVWIRQLRPGSHASRAEISSNPDLRTCRVPRSASERGRALGLTR